MKLSEIQKEVEALSTSSAFRAGDALTFGVRVVELEAELLGPCDAQDYMDLVRRKLALKIGKNSRVLVIGAGNGGLCAEALLAGASEVIACEPRFRYADAVEKITRLLDQVHEAPVCRTYRGWPSRSTVGSLGRFDLILWPEGTEECQQPVETITAVLQMLKNDGCAVIEVLHGTHGIAEGKVNSFLPSEAAWNGLIENLTGKGPSGSVAGRASNRVIYGIGTAKADPEVKPTPKSSLPPFPKDAPKPTPKPPTPEPEQPMGLPVFPRDAPIASSLRVGSNLPPVEEAPAPEPESVTAEEPTPVEIPEAEPEAESIPVSLPEEATPLTLPEEDAAE